MTKNAGPSAGRRFARVVIALILSLLCWWGIWFAGRIGFSRLLTEYSAASGELAPADAAVRLTPNDSRARTIRGLLFSQSGDFANAAIELERAAALRPRDYFLWLELGVARDQINDTAGALSALSESVRLAPHYARPRWQLGNLLLRLRRRDEALAELRRAAKSDPVLLPGAIDLAWGSLRNAEGVREAIQPQSTFEHIALARFFAQHGNGTEAVTEFRRAGVISPEERRDLIAELMAQRSFAAAYEIWVAEHGDENSSSAVERSRMYDGGFEKAMEIKDPGFGWRVSQDNPAINLSLDSADPHQGGKSLRIEFRGASNPQAAAISQIILVEPETRYRLQFAARTQELVSGGLPLVVIGDAVFPSVTFSESPPFPGGTDQWREYVADFTTGKQTQAVLLQVRRRPCTTEPCPIFGMLWLDAFVLQKA